MQNTYEFIYGIDVSKDYLDICLLQGTASSFRQIPNTAPALVEWISSLAQGRTLCVMEPTGSYSCRLLHLLCRQGIAVSVVNPHQSSHFVKALGIINQNDRKAAEALALMGRSLDLPLYQMENIAMQKRKQILSSLRALKKQRQMLQNQLHALSYQAIVQPAVQKAFEQTLETVNEQIELLEGELDSLSDEEHQKQMAQITSVVGIGDKTAQALLCATGGLDVFDHDRQLAKFIGIVPSSHNSGSSVRYRGPITKKGNSELRACLYMAARSAKRFNLACKELYERLRSRGKCHKQAMVAVMNKLIRQVFAVVKNNRPFDNQYYLRYKSV